MSSDKIKHNSTKLCSLSKLDCTIHTHTHTRLTAICPGLPGWAGTRKAKPIWILLKQETVSDSGISWAICKSAPRSRQITTPAPHRSVFLQAGCPSCRPTNSVKALKAHYTTNWNKCKLTKHPQHLANISPDKTTLFHYSTRRTMITKTQNAN